MVRHLKRAADIGLTAVSIEGGLISPDQMAAIAGTTPDQKAAADYGCPKGTNLRDEITRYFRIGQAHWQSYAKLTAPNVVQTAAFVRSLLQEAFGFEELTGPNVHHADGHTYRIALEAKCGRVPIVVAAPLAEGEAFAKALAEMGDDPGGTIPRRSPAVLLQDWLNANPEFLWGLVFAGDRVRLMRDNASFTRATYIEADLGAIFRDEMFADFTAMWLLIHSSRFGGEGALASDCALERWREAGLSAGTAARERLGEGVEEALLALGQGFLDANSDLREKLDDHRLTEANWFEQLLRVVYRLIFLAVSEDRDLLHARDASPEARNIYAWAYGFSHMRERSARRSSHDHHHDVWEGAKIVFNALEHGEDVLGLPPLGGLFGPGQTPDLDTARLPNRSFLSAVFRLSWLIEDGRRVRINWRDMATEELGSVYEGLLELVPTRSDNGRRFSFAGGDEARGNARKRSGSYYTPDSLVQALLDSTLDPVLDRAEAHGGVPAILQLSVIDPACGSGHFLLGAARRIAGRVALLRDSETPDYPAAMRDVARYCIHGVDRNPMAIELAKVALWIETVEPGKPLGFLDANLRCGDSLVGVFDLSVLDRGIPDEAFKALPGDDPEVTSAYRAKNRRETKERYEISGGLPLFRDQRSLSKSFSTLLNITEEKISDIEAKRRAYEDLMSHEGVAQKLRTACDLWASAWFIPKVEAPVRGREMVPTSGQLWEYLRGAPLHLPLILKAEDCARDHRFFHWPVEFPDIIANGGFDVVIGNPPWERVEVQEKELFAVSHPEIANAANAAKRKRMIEALEVTDNRAFSTWQAALRAAATEVAFHKESKRFPLGASGKINTYALFADLFRVAINKFGMAGFIVPSNLVVGFTYREYLSEILTRKSLCSFFGFENEDLLFVHVTNKLKFGLMTLSGSEHPTEKPWFTAHLRQPREIDDPERRYSLSIEDITSINPNTLNLPAFRWAKDADLAAAIHRAAPVLVRKLDGESDLSPWGARFKSLFNMSSDAGSFIDHDDISSMIVDRIGSMVVLNDGRRLYPLYEGKMFWHFDHRYGSYEGQTEQQANKGVLPRVSEHRHDDPVYRIQPRYWVDLARTDDVLGEFTDEWLFAWRDVGPAERTFVGTVIPRAAAGNTAYLLSSVGEPNERVSLAAILASLLVDYAARQKSDRMKYFVVEQLPIIPPESLATRSPFLGEVISKWISDRAIELYYTNEEIAPLAQELGRDHPPFRFATARRALLQAEIDAAVLHLYGLRRTQVEWLLDSFRVLRDYEERDHGEFRTRRLVLEIYEQMAVVKREGRIYQTLLSPVPGDTSCCHPTATVPPQRQPAPLIDNLWARSSQQPGDPGAALAAVLKGMQGSRPTREVRLSVALILQPRLLVPLLDSHQRAEWRRLVGAEAEPLPSNVATFVASTNAAWGAAVRNHRGNGRLIEDLTADTWSTGVGLDQIETAGWPDGRAGFVFEALSSIDFDVALNSLPPEVQQWIGDAAAA